MSARPYSVSNISFISAFACRRGKGHKNFIAHNVPEIIVYCLEIVNICHKESADAAVGKISGYFLLEKLSVIKASKCIKMS